MTQNIVLSPITVGSLSLPNRVVMAPLTRCRASQNHVPNEMMAEYYSQRATAGLIIAEATMAMKGNSSFIAEPGIYSQEQVAGWKKVTKAVHQNGGRIFLQLWHGGRACHPSLNDGQESVAPSAIAIESDIQTLQGKVPHVVPRALRDDEIPGIVAGFVFAAQNAKEAGFDGVEVHGANGYLLDEFLRDSSNRRSGPYGGSLQNRAKLLLEVTDAVIGVWGAGRVGVRISPLNSYNSMRDSDPLGLTLYVAQQLNQRRVAYLHLMRADFFGKQSGDVVTAARKGFSGVLIVNMGYTPSEANEAIKKNIISAVSFGHHYVSNPDLVACIEKGIPFIEPDASTFYTPGPKGYIDYPRRVPAADSDHARV
jgi:N-ethylmaleimide reductase